MMLEIKDIARELGQRVSSMGQAPREEKLQQLKEILKERTGNLAPEQRVRFLEDLEAYCSVEVEKPSASANDSSLLGGLARIILGKDMEGLESMDQEQLLKRLQDSMTTIFRTLNQIVQSLHAAAGLDNGFSPEKTIRMLIHERLSSAEDTGGISIQAYLDHIKEAFDAVKEAFEQALDEKIRELTGEMTPEKLARDLGNKAIRLGPLYKASLFDLYEDRFRHLKGFIDQGLFTREVMLAFERHFSERLSDSMKRTGTT